MVRRAIFLVLLCLCLAGCSSPYKLVVHNETRYPIVVEVTWQGSDKEQSQTWELEPGEAKERLVWYGSAPDRVEVKVASARATLSKVFLPAHYPREMIEGGGSMGPTCHLFIGEPNWRLAGPMWMDGFQDALPLLAFMGCCGIGPIVLVVWLTQRSKVRK